MRTFYLVRRSFGDPDIPDLSLFNQLGHGANGFFDRYFGIDAVLVIDIDGIDAQAFQTAFNRFEHVFRCSIQNGALRSPLHTELGGDEQAIAFAFDGFAQ